MLQGKIEFLTKGRGYIPIYSLGRIPIWGLPRQERIMIYRLKFLVCISIISLLSSCGGGSGDSGSTTGNEISTGVITGFGSVFVNGTRFKTDSATIRAGD